MCQFPYPIQYFSCRDFEAPPEKARTMLRYLAKLGTHLAGPVAGETGLPGLKIDFNDGLRLQVPAGNWHVTIGDYDSGMVFYDQDVSETLLISMEKYYVHWQVEVLRDGAPAFAHVFDPVGQKIRVVFNTSLLGDVLSFFPYLPCVRKAFGAADVYYSIDGKLQDLSRRMFPEIRMADGVEDDTYATYYFNITPLDFPGSIPLDGRSTSLSRAGQFTLGLPALPPKPAWPAGPRLIHEPYVCIGVQASSTAKGWLYPGGWEEVVAYIKGLGFRVLCIDRDKKTEGFGYTVELPAGAEDFTGDRPLLERADMLHHAEFFIGLSSGLSWLAYTAGCPVVLICGFTQVWNEFSTPYRVYNRLACHGCYNDPRYDWREDVCPRQEKGSDAMFQCSRTITPRMVIAAVDRLLADRRSETPERP